MTTRRGRRLRIDEAGRVLAGVPPEARGVQLRELGPYWGERRGIMATDCRPGRVAQTYGTKAEGLRALLEANPELFDFLESQSGRHAHDQALDPIRERLERDVASWGEAVLAVIPGAARGRRPRWAELEARLPILEEALESSPGWRGGRLHPPGPAARARGAEEGQQACETGKLDALDELGARYAAAGALEEAPF